MIRIKSGAAMAWLGMLAGALVAALCGIVPAALARWYGL